ncbi:MAG: addiction module toxin RelE [Candidatus Altiarchaeota archaeon]
MREFEVSEHLTKKLRKYGKKDKKLFTAAMKKMREILECPDVSHYKNLRYDLRDSRRVHVDKSFVLVFQHDAGKDKIIFDDIDHHDKIYESK